MSKKIFNKRRKRKLAIKYIIRIGIAFILIGVLVLGEMKIALIGKSVVIKRNTENKVENNIDKNKDEILNNEKNNEVEEITVELPKYDDRDIVPGSNVTFEGKAHAVSVQDVKNMVDGSYYGDEKYIFLTFDDGPSPLTNKVLDILNENNVKATFFILGSMLEDGQLPKDTLKRTIMEGHALANHSYSHNFKSLYPGNVTDIDYFMKEFDKTNTIMKEILGVEFDTNVLRMPGGYNSRVYYNDKNLGELNAVLKGNNIVSVDWNALNGDAEGKQYSDKQMIDYVKRTSNGKNQVVLLMHDTYGKEKTVNILPEIIKYYKEQGYEFKTISDANL